MVFFLLCWSYKMYANRVREFLKVLYALLIKYLQRLVGKQFALPMKVASTKIKFNRF